MKAIKRRLAVVLAVLLMIPAQPVMAVEALPDGIVTEREDADYDVTAGEEDLGKDTSANDVADVGDGVSGGKADPGNADTADTEEDLKIGENSGDAKDSGAKEDQKTDQDIVDSEDSENEEFSEADENLGTDQGTVGTEDSRDKEVFETGGKPESVKSSGEEKPDVGKDNTDVDAGKNAGNSGEDKNLEKETASDHPNVPDGGEDSTDGKSDNRQGSSENGNIQNEQISTDNSDSENKPDGKDQEIPEEELADMELLLDDLTLASPSNGLKVSNVAEEEVKFNTGNHVFSVVSREDFFDRELGDAFFAEDGSYTINIPEPNPFFPYEVQFTYDGKVTREWFMTPDDTVEIGGHVFHVSAYFDGTVVTRMTMRVGGDIVVVYPEKKKFTDDEAGGIEMLSLLPLEERIMSVDLSAYTPAELTMVSLDEIFMGEDALGSGDKVVWRSDSDGDDYQISAPGAIIDLGYNTAYSSGNARWEMIVGDDDQLAAGNIRYRVNVQVTESRVWLIPTASVQNTEGKRESLRVVNTDQYRDSLYSSRDRERNLEIYVPSEQLQKDDVVYVSLSINDSVFASTGYDSLKVYEGAFFSAEEAASGTEITDKIFDADLTQADTGYAMKRYENRWVTIITYDTDGNVSGCLPLLLEVWTVTMEGHISFGSLYKKSQNSYVYVTDTTRRNKLGDKDYEVIYTLYKGYAASERYHLEMNYRKENENLNEAVTAAYAGRYTTIAEAQNAGAAEIKAELFGSSGNGYAADYSQGISFTIFVGEDGAAGQEVYHYRVVAKEGTSPKPLSSNIYLSFHDLIDSTGAYVDTYEVPYEEDSYDQYRTLLVEEDVDLTRLAPVFYIDSRAKLYAEGSDAPEVSGESYHDFSKGPVHYTVSAENGEDSRNYWLKVVKAGTAGGKLYINSLEDEASNTREENGITYSTREMYLDGRFDYIHDILLMNVGTAPIPKISAELVSDEVQLDAYWTLNGEYELAGIDTTDPDFYIGDYSALWNQAKLGIRAKDGVADGREIKGTLTIRSGETTLMVLNLTGIVGDPGISTKEIPQAVKYVPYGTMIQNNNKYSWNKVSYEFIDGTLPEGMELRPNGELYGVPKETGEFTFTILMENSYEEFAPSERTFTLTVIENTDNNVDGATDQGYTLTQRIQNVNLYAASDQTMVSQGIYDEFVDIFLDGEKLVKDQDYTSESGSTRITIRGETLKKSNTPGKHTLGIEFRTKDTNTLKRAAQNYEITTKSTSGGSNIGSGGSSSGGSGSSSSSSGSVTRDSRKGYVNSVTGIITGAGDGYSNWQQDASGWKLVYVDGTAAAGHMAEQPDGTTVEQVAWEKINGAWYAFGVDGYLKSGWVFDYQLGSWYCVSVEKGMLSGWYKDTQDGFTYYMDPATGKLVAGWKQLDGKWYYFNEVSAAPTYLFDKKTGAWFYNALSQTKPFGAMYQNEETPDGYSVNEEGVWSGQTR